VFSAYGTDIVSLTQGANSRALESVADASSLVVGGTCKARNSAHGYAVYSALSGTRTELRNVTCSVADASNQAYGIFSTSACSTFVYDCSFTVTGGTTTYGVYNNSGAVFKGSNVAITVSNGTTSNYGLANVGVSTAAISSAEIVSTGSGTCCGAMVEGDGSYLAMHGSLIRGASTSTSCGVQFVGMSSATLDNCLVQASGGTTARALELLSNGSSVNAYGSRLVATGGSTSSYGVYDVTGTSVNLEQCVVEGTTAWVYTGGGSLTAANTRLVGGPTAGTGGLVQCTGTSRVGSFQATGCP